MKKCALLLIATQFCLQGCFIQREPGPGERIGRAIDDIRQSVQELAPEETPDERRAREDREWRRRQDEYYQKSRTRGADLYGETTEEREARDREYWENPIADDSRKNDRY